MPFDIYTLHDAASDELEELAVTFALEALDAEEGGAYVRHMQVCHICYALALEYQGVATVLPELISEQQEASPGLKERILAEARKDLIPQSSVVPERPAVRGVGKAKPWWRSRWLSPIPVGATAAALAVIAVASWNIALQREVDIKASTLDKQIEVAATQKLLMAEQDEELEDKFEMIGHQTEALAEQEQVLEALVEGAWVWPLWPMFEDVEEVSGAVVQYRGSNTVLLLLKDLPSLPPDRTYQVWRMMEDKPESAGLIAPVNPEASRFQTVKLETDFTVADAGSISVEPAGGSSYPTLVVLYGRYAR